MVLDQIQRYRVHTIPPTHELNLCIICFYKMGPQKLSKIQTFVILQIYRMHGKIMRPVIFFTGRMIFLPDAWFLTYHEI